VKHSSKTIAIAAVAVALSAAGPVSGAASADTLTTFTTYDNTAYSTATIGHGSIRSNLVPNFECKALTASGTTLPTKSAWQAKVVAYDTNPGPLVLDCEDLYLNGTTSNAAAHEAKLSQLQAWAREVEPTKPIGWYGLANNTPTANTSYYQMLLAQDSNTAFFPSAYTFSSSQETWQSSLVSSVSKARAIDGSVKIYPFVWPQYHGGSSPSSLDYTFIPGALFSFELSTIAEMGLDGAVIWSGLPQSNTCDATCDANAGSQSWLPAAQNFLDYVAAAPSDLARTGTATTSSVKAAGREAALAVDGDPLTRWGSAYADPQWLEVDLGSVHTITGARLSWETAYASAYQIQVSTDNTTWTTIYSTTTGGGGVEYVNGLSGNGRYVRMYGTQRGTSYGYSLWDFNIFGS